VEGFNAHADTKKAPERSWQTLYRIALFETDRVKAAAYIEEAERAAIARAQDLFYRRTDTIQERDALEDALYALRALKSSLSWESVSRRAA
jgi:hypothetical protein